MAWSARDLTEEEIATLQRDLTERILDRARRCTCPRVEVSPGAYTVVRAAFCPVDHDAMNVRDDGTIEMPYPRR